MLYRPQRGGLDESLRATGFMVPTYAALAEYFNVSVDRIKCHFYYHDTLRGWSNTHIVLVDGVAMGFVNEKPE
jgi:hypothetical protein